MKIRFGMIVTDGRGKAGGQYIRKFGSNHVLQNITVPVRRLGSLQNTSRLFNAWLFSLWATLADAQKTEWANIASNLSALNVFGEVRSVGAREAYNKCNMLYYPFSQSFVDTNDFNYVVPFNNVTAFQTNLNLNEFFVFLGEIPSSCFMEIRAKRLKYLSQKVNVSKLKIFARTEDFVDAEIMWDYFTKAYPDIATGQYFSIACRFINMSGVPSPFFQYPMIVD